MREWRNPGQKLHLTYVIPIFKSGCPVVSVFCGLPMKGRITLVETLGADKN